MVGGIIMAETRIALVSGANRGIGLEIVRQLARSGVMAVIGSRDLSKGHDAAATLQSEGLDAPVVELDAGRKDSIHAAVAKVIDMFGRLDILVNNAGVFIDEHDGGDLQSVGTNTLEETFTTNVYGPVWLTQAVLPVMKAQGYGRIVNLSSDLAQLSEMGGSYASYRMSKAALNAMTRVVAGDLAGSTADIKINSASPGWVRTDMGGADATLSVEEGAETPVWLALLPEDGPTGGFFRDKKAFAW